MSTPIPTRSIVLGKWWGAFRLVPWLALLPGFGASVVAATAPERPPVPIRAIGPGGVRIMAPPVPPLELIDRVAAGALPFLSTIAQGAFIVSVGVLLAVWIKKPGRAMAASVVLYVVGSIGMLFLLELGVFDALFKLLYGFLHAQGYSTNVRDHLGTLVVFALFFCTALGGQEEPLGLLMNGREADRSLVWFMLTGAIVLTLLASLFVLGLTLLTFNRCMGRVGERPRKPGQPPRSALRIAPPARRVRPVPEQAISV
jgi:hypothetical protein